MNNLGSPNKVLLSKWSWLFPAKRGPQWNEVIRGKYGELEGGRYSSGGFFFWVGGGCCWR